MELAWSYYSGVCSYSQSLLCYYTRRSVDFKREVIEDPWPCETPRVHMTDGDGRGRTGTDAPSRHVTGRTGPWAVHTVHTQPHDGRPHDGRPHDVTYP